MKLFPFKGGVHPPGHKQASSASAIARMPLPERLFVPMQQHIGAPAEPCVKIGQRVLKGEPVGKPRGAISAMVHASASGTVRAVEEYPAPHPSGLPVLCVEIEPDGREEWFEVPLAKDPFELEPELVAERVEQAGIVGMGGATFPTAVKLGGANSHHTHTLMINGGECEPYLTCDDRLMREHAAEVIDGIRLMLHGIEGTEAIVAIEDNKPEATKAMQEAAAAYGEVRVVNVPTRYPMGSEKQLISTVTGREVPAGALTSALGILVHNVATAYAVHEALRYGHALVERVVTVAGGAVREPGNVFAPIGTPLKDLVAFRGGFKEEPARLLLGGPMMGYSLSGLEAPVVKGASGLLALSAAEVRPAQASPCIRCGRCVQACPIGLMPLELAARSRAVDLDGALDWGLRDCISCGSCAYVCPAHIPLVQYFNFAKGELAGRAAAERKQKEIKRLAEARALRIEAEQRKKAEEMARRKAERAAAKQRAEAEAAAQAAGE